MSSPPKFAIQGTGVVCAHPAEVAAHSMPCVIATATVSAHDTGMEMY
jgi:hypothetical protein